MAEHGVAVSGFEQRLDESCSQRIGVGTGHKVAKEIFVEHFGDAAHAGADNAEAAGKGFEDDVGHAFLLAREAEEIGGLHVAGNLGGAFAANQTESLRGAELRGEAADVGFEWPVANHDEFAWRSGETAEFRMRADEEERVLHGQKIAHVENHLSVGGEAELLAGGHAVAGAEGGGVHAVINRPELHERHAGLAQPGGKVAAAGDGGRSAERACTMAWRRSGMCR